MRDACHSLSGLRERVGKLCLRSVRGEGVRKAFRPSRGSLQGLPGRKKMAQVDDHITILRFDELSSVEQGITRQLAARLYSRVEHYAQDPLLIVEVKKQEKDGKVVKYAVHSRVRAPTIIASVRQADWDLARALHKTFENLLNELEHKYKKVSRQKKRKSFTRLA